MKTIDWNFIQMIIYTLIFTAITVTIAILIVDDANRGAKNNRAPSVEKVSYLK